jgi:hypothetical protein
LSEGSSNIQGPRVVPASVRLERQHESRESLLEIIVIGVQLVLLTCLLQDICHVLARSDLDLSLAEVLVYNHNMRGHVWQGFGDGMRNRVSGFQFRDGDFGWSFWLLKAECGKKSTGRYASNIKRFFVLLEPRFVRCGGVLLAIGRQGEEAVKIRRFW